MRKYAVIPAILALMLMASLVAVTASAEPNNGETRPTMEPLFSFQIKRTSDQATFPPRGPREGDHVGSGEGTVDGRLKGVVRWSLYENSRPQACTMQFVGQILTEDGVTIPFEGQGFAIIPDHDTPSQWATGGAFRFEPGDSRYAWLDSKLAVWEGDFNMNTLEARLTFYAPRTE